MPDNQSVFDGRGPHYLGFYEDKESMANEEFNFKEGTADLQRIFLGPWHLRLDFIRVAVFLQVSGDPNAGTQTVISPARYPGFELARAFRASIKAGLVCSGKDDENVITHRIARITVHYGVETFGGTDNDDPNENDPDFVYVEESVISHIDLIPIHGTQVKTISHADQPSSNPDGSPYKPADTYLYEEHKTVNYVNILYDYKLKVPYIVFPRWLDMNNAGGKVNSTIFVTPSGFVCIPGTLRYDGISAITKRELSQNALVWEIEHAFAFRRETWNTVPVVGTDGAGICHQKIEPLLFRDYELRKIFIPYSNQKSQELGIVFANWLVGGNTRATKYLYGDLTESDLRALWNALPGHAFLNARPIILPDDDD